MSLRPHLTTRTIRALFLLAMASGSAFITVGSLSYFFGADIHPFVLEKITSGQLASEATWIAALRVHVIAAAFALPACLLLTLRCVSRRLPRFHRWLGRVTGVAVLVALVPSGCYLALWAKGGAPSTAGFLLSGAIAAIAMVRGVRTARARDIVGHRRWMAHVLAQLSVAVTSRAMLIAFDRASVDPERAYIAALWLPVVGSALVAELVTTPVRRRRKGDRRNDDALRVPVLVRDSAR
jgi:uncharacterized membrane protein